MCMGWIDMSRCFLRQKANLVSDPYDFPLFHVLRCSLHAFHPCFRPLDSPHLVSISNHPMGMTPLIDQALMSYETVCLYVMQWCHNFISLNSFGHVNTTVKFLAIFKLCFFFSFFCATGSRHRFKKHCF